MLKSKRKFALIIICVFLVATFMMLAAGCKSLVCSFETNGGNTISEITISKGKKIELPTPEKYGAEFGGWYDNEDFNGDKYEKEFEPSNTTTLYAKWLYTITFFTDGGSEIQPIKATHNQFMVLPSSPTKEGYSFIGWFRNSATTGEIISSGFKPTSSMTLFAKWNNYSIVSFNSNGGGNIQEIKLNYGQALTLPQPPTKENSLFDGWYLNPEFSGDKVESGIVPNETITLYAKWIDIYTIRFDSLGGNNVEDIRLQESQGLTLPTPPTKEHCNFEGWYINSDLTGEKISNGYVPTSSVTLYAKWTIKSYTLSFENDIASPIVGEAESWITLPSVTQNDRALVGWIKQGDSSITYYAGEKFKLNQDITLYPSWVEYHSQGDFETADFGGGCIITGFNYTGDYITVAIPKVIRGKQVLAIAGGDELAGGAFRDKTEVGMVIIPQGVQSIGEYAFYGCENMSRIALPDSIESIGANAFGNTLWSNSHSNESVMTIGQWIIGHKGNLNSQLTFENEIIGIADEAFKDEGILTRVNLPLSLKYIGNSAFDGCINLRTMSLPDSLLEVGDSAFHNCKSLGKVELKANVKAIGSYAFSKCINLTQLILEDGVAFIGEYAFTGCEKLNSINIPKSVTTISKGAFNGCKKIESLTIEEGVQHIGDYAFINCEKIQEVIIPNSIKDIGIGAFEDCSTLRTVTLSTALTVLNELVFAKTALKIINIPGNITDIKERAFFGCVAMENATIDVAEGAGNLTIGEYAFNECTALTSVTLTERITTIGRGAFMGCSKLSWINLSVTKIKEISDELLSGCRILPNITLPPTIERIGNQAFKDCENINEFVIGDTVNEIGENAFMNSGWDRLHSLGDVLYLGNWLIGNKGAELFGTLTIQRDTKGIANKAFFGKNEMTSVILPDSVTIIGDNAFNSCQNLMHIRILGNTPAQLGADVFSLSLGAKIVVPLSFGDTFKTNENWTNYASYIEEEYSYENINGVGIKITKYNGNLQSVTIPDVIDSKNVVEIGDSAFENNTSVWNITLPSTLTSIGNNAFSGCTSLKHMIIPERVESIGNNAFDGCAILQGIQFKSENPPTTIGTDCFANLAATAKLVVPLSSKVNYQTVFSSVVEEFDVASSGGSCGITKYNGFESDVIIPNAISGMSVTEIKGADLVESGAFYGNENVKKVTIPSSVTVIGNYAFTTCFNLEEIILVGTPGLETIGKHAFWGCTQLSTITWPASLTTIGEGAFLGCEKLTAIEIPQNVTSIGINAFGGCIGISSITVAASNAKYISQDNCLIDTDTNKLILGCTSLEEMTIPTTVTIIGENAFAGNRNICTLTLSDNVETIESNAFSDMQGLSSINLGSGVIELGGFVFSNCTNLRSITIVATAPPTINNDTFNGLTDITEIYVPSELVEIYKNAWANNADRIKAIVV